MAKTKDQTKKTKSTKHEAKKDQPAVKEQGKPTPAKDANIPPAAKAPKVTADKPMSTADKSRALSMPLVIALFALIISILAVGESAYYWSQTHIYREQFDNRIAALEGSNTTNQDKLRSLQQETVQSEQQLKIQQALLSQTQKGLHKAVALTHANMAYWKLLEAAHLIRLANINLLYDHNVKGSIVLLTNANQRIADLNDPAYLKLQQMLVDDIMQLKSVASINTADLVSRIDALSKQIATLPLSIKNATDDNAIDAKQQTATNNSLRERLKQSWFDLKNSIIIRHQTKPVEPLITPDEQVNLVRNIQLQLSQAQWAVLRGNKKLYQMSLKQVQDWLQKYFSADNATVKAAVSEAVALSQINISPKLPNLEATLKTIQGIIDTQQQPTLSNTLPSTQKVKVKANEKKKNNAKEMN